MSKFKLTQTATEVQDILNNSLQKPTGLSKTKLVGVGVNGQENIEIGDNLTLANGKLSSAAGGGGNINLYHHCIRLIGEHGNPADVISFDLYNTYSAEMKWGNLLTYIVSNACSGYVRDGSGETPKYYFANYLYTDSDRRTINIFCAGDNRLEKEMKLHGSDYGVIDFVNKVL